MLIMGLGSITGGSVDRMSSRQSALTRKNDMLIMGTAFLLLIVGEFQTTEAAPGRLVALFDVARYYSALGAIYQFRPASPVSTRYVVRCTEVDNVSRWSVRSLFAKGSRI